MNYKLDEILVEKKQIILLNKDIFLLINFQVITSD